MTVHGPKNRSKLNEQFSSSTVFPLKYKGLPKCRLQLNSTS